MAVAREIGTPIECERCGESSWSYFGTRGPLFYGPVCFYCHPSTLLQPRSDGGDGA